MKQTTKVVTTDGIEIFFFNNDFSSGVSKAKDFVSEKGGTIYRRKYYFFGAWVVYSNN